ncbi:LacI family DNA-binding transcriptional regulator [Clostridium sp. KNHs214]|uniref:LacI family DNA-binding transcriptional regulator n=1 Tax=Clostridium sp. KNHs214 TaxID=1540257 RepID=UPI0005597755|nr:LacI family DNA-binding transcriptional regulator [Clostridium sp. KNHs214]
MAVTIKHIADKAGVSLATVSRVLNDSGYVKEETRKKVVQAIKELNYTPSAIARSLTKKKTNVIGVVVPDINNPHFGELIKGISKVVDAANLNMILCDTDESPDKELKALQLLREQRIEGIIVSPTSNENDFNSECLNTLENLGIPIVLLDGDVKYSNFSGVFVDNIKGAYEGTAALIKEGHNRIAIITGRINSKPAKDRLIGYKKALAANNIDIREEYIFYGDYKEESGYKLTKEILNMKERPTAIFSSNNMMTLGCIKALNEHGISIPKDMAMVAFDELKVLNILGMNISFISTPTEEMGRTAMELLLENLKDKEKTQVNRITLHPKLLLKGSERFK